MAHAFVGSGFHALLSFINSVAFFNPASIRSISGFGVSIPDFDFFWNTCSTITAAAKRTVYTARLRVSSLRLDNL